MSRYHLFKALEKAGYPMQGAGGYLISPDGNDKVYVPRPEEIYAQFIGDPFAWEILTDTLAMAWIENKTGKPYLVELHHILKNKILEKTKKRPSKAIKSRKKK